MDDRNIMENLLLLEKGVCDLYMHGAIESSTDNVRNTFSESLNTALNLQDQIYDKMQSRGRTGRKQQAQQCENEICSGLRISLFI